MPYLKVVEYRSEQIQSWQMLVVVGETEEQLSERVEKSISRLDDSFRYEFKEYPIAEISEEKSEEIQNCDAKELKNIAISEVEEENASLTRDEDDFDLLI